MAPAPALRALAAEKQLFHTNSSELSVFIKKHCESLQSTCWLLFP